MARRQGQLNDNTGRVEVRKVCSGRRGDFDRARVDTPLRRLIRAAVH